MFTCGRHEQGNDTGWTGQRRQPSMPVSTSCDALIRKVDFGSLQCPWKVGRIAESMIGRPSAIMAASAASASPKP